MAGRISRTLPRSHYLSKTPDYFFLGFKASRGQVLLRRISGSLDSGRASNILLNSPQFSVLDPNFLGPLGGADLKHSLIH